MANLKPASFPYHDLDCDLYDGTEDSYTNHLEESNSQLHLRLPPGDRSTRHSSYGNTNSTNRYDNGSNRESITDVSPLWLHEIATENTSSTCTSSPSSAYQDYHDNDDDALLILEQELDDEEDEKSAGCVDRFYEVFGKCFVIWPHRYFPGSILILAFMTSLTAAMAYVAWVKYPPQRILDDILDDATKGFETRGTYIRKAMATGEQLVNELYNPYSPYSLCPDVWAAASPFNLSIPDPPVKDGMSRIEVSKLWQGCLRTFARRKRSLEEAETSGTRKIRSISSKRIEEENLAYFDIDNYMVFVFENKAGNKDMLNVKAVHALCDVTEKKLYPLFPKTGQFQPGEYWHIGHMIALYFGVTNITSCKDITQNHIDIFRRNLHYCLARDGIKNPDTQTQRAIDCRYEIFNFTAKFMMEVDFTQNKDPLGEIKYTTVLLTTLKGFLWNLTKEQTDFFVNHLDKRGKRIEMNDIELTAVRFPDQEEMKYEVFQIYIISDMIWFGLALGLVFFLMLIYLLRFDLVVATLISIISGFILAYVVYFSVIKTLDSDFFPFINILGLLVLIAIGADDVFVFFDLFEQVRLRHSHWSLHKMISKTLSHAVPSIFVTSFTTASAFYANSVSNITSVKLFGFFAGTAVLLNFFVMVLVVPSVIVLSELALRPCEVQRIRSKLADYTGLKLKYTFGYDKQIPRKILSKAWPVFLVIFGLVGIGGCIIVFVKPRFQLPVTSDFQLFPSKNLLEHWDLNVKQHFLFERDVEVLNDIELYYFWGFESHDPGSHYNPDKNTGKLIEDRNFDFYDRDSQIWLDDYCKKVRKADYVSDDFNTNTMCLFETYEYVIEQLCIGSSVRYPYNILLKSSECCASKNVPFGRTQLERCGPLYDYLFIHPLSIGHFEIDLVNRDYPAVLGKVIYKLTDEIKTTNKIVGFSIEVETNYKPTFEYDIMDRYHQALGGKFKKDVAEGPREIQGGICAYAGWFWFYDLQHSLATGTYFSIGLSLIVAFIVMLVTSLNAIITLYAMITIGFAIACTVAVLVLMGWHLNIIESIIISLSVGLSIDFTIHYGVAYRLSKESDSKSRTSESYARVGPAVLMAAITTFTAGACMMPCHVLPYTQLGVFLMLVMTFAWLYATFFFQSLCWIIGPKHNSFQWLWKKCLETFKKARSREQQVNSTATLSIQADNSTPLQPLDVSDDDSLLVTF